MSLPERFKSPSGVLHFLETEDGKILVDYFQEMKDKSIKQLRRDSDVRMIYYTQGSADAAEKISDLRKDILQYQDDLRTGKIKKPEQGAKS